uniref:Odorant receptor n=1 Tax=Glossina morsitans morsitans TaxID=37546 RepID=A0A1B0GFY1_GLOMM
MYYRLPLFSVNVKGWLYFGYIGKRNQGIKSLLIVNALLTLAAEILLYIKTEDVSNVIRDIFKTAILFNSLVRILYVMRREEDFIQFMKGIESWYQEFKDDNDHMALAILNRLPKYTKLVTAFGLSFGSIGAVASTITALLWHTHIFPIYVPGFDAFQSPLYEIINLWQSITMVSFVMSAYILFTNLFISWLIFGIGLLEILCKKFEQMSSANDAERLRNLKYLIRYHKRIIRYGEELEDLVALISMVELILFTVMLCVLLVFFLITENFVDQIATVIYIFSIFYVLFISYWHTNAFSAESLKIPDAAYRIDWAESGPETRKCLLILISRSQTALQISESNRYT